MCDAQFLFENHLHDTDIHSLQGLKKQMLVEIRDQRQLLQRVPRPFLKGKGIQIVFVPDADKLDESHPHVFQLSLQPIDFLPLFFQLR